MRKIIAELLKKPLSWLVLAIVVMIVALLLLANVSANRKVEIGRLKANQETLLGEVEHYCAENGKLAASVQSLTLQRDELEGLLPEYKRTIENLRIRVRDLESLGEVSTSTELEIEAPVTTVYDTVHIEKFEPLAREFSWDDGYVALCGRLVKDSVRVNIKITDTITVVAHRKPRGWWIFKCKGKIVKYSAISANPHTQINHIKYIEMDE